MIALLAAVDGAEKPGVSRAHAQCGEVTHRLRLLTAWAGDGASVVVDQLASRCHRPAVSLLSVVGFPVSVSSVSRFWPIKRILFPLGDALGISGNANEKIVLLLL